MTIKAASMMEFGYGGPEESTGGEALPDGNYCCVIPQEDVTITSIAIADGLCSTNWTGKTLLDGRPWYCPFSSSTSSPTIFSGKVHAYKVPAKAAI